MPAAVVMSLVLSAKVAAMPIHPAPGEPVVIAHRGASGMRPEHTLEAYRLAVAQGADYIEPDLVLTRDGVLVARHENEISETTDVADRPEFSARRRTAEIDGKVVTGWFTEDFTLEEIRSLRARERLPELRAASSGYDGHYPVPTFAGILDLVDSLDEERLAAAQAAGLPAPPRIGVYPETKHPTYFLGLGLDFQPPLLEELGRRGRLGAESRVFVQSFEVANLKRLRAAAPALPLVQLMAGHGAPADQAAAGAGLDYRVMATPPGLAAVASYANAIGVAKEMLIPRDRNGRLGDPTALVADAHAAGLAVHAWTFRAENEFLPIECRRGPDRAGIGDLGCELSRFLALGIDGFFTDHTALAIAAMRGPAGTAR